MKEALKNWLRKKEASKNWLHEHIFSSCNGLIIGRHSHHLIDLLIKHIVIILHLQDNFNNSFISILYHCSLYLFFRSNIWRQWTARQNQFNLSLFSYKSKSPWSMFLLFINFHHKMSFPCHDVVAWKLPVGPTKLER